MKRSTSALAPTSEKNVPTFLVYHLTMKDDFAPSLIYGEDQTDGKGKSRLGSVVSTDPAPGDMVYRRRLIGGQVNLSLSELTMMFPVNPGKDER